MQQLLGKYYVSVIVEEQIHIKLFYQDTLYFDESIWNLDIVESQGYSELK